MADDFANRLANMVVRAPGQRLGRQAPAGFGVGGLGQPKRATPRLSGISIGQTDEGRPLMMNQDSSFSSQRLATIQTDQGFVNVPTIFNGQSVPIETALDILRSNGMVDPETGRLVEFFATPTEAENDARNRSQGIDEALIRALRQTGLRE